MDVVPNRKQQKVLLSLLRGLRVQAGIRQIDMARALGKPQAFVSYYESGARRLELLELRQISASRPWRHVLAF